MGDCFPSGESVSQGTDCFFLQQIHINKKQNYRSNAEHDLEDDLPTNFSRSLHIQDVKELENNCIEQSGVDVITSRETENFDGELKICQTEAPTISSQKSFRKCETFPSSGMKSSAGSSGEEDDYPDAKLLRNCSLKSINPDLSRSVPLPVSLLFSD